MPNDNKKPLSDIFSWQSGNADDPYNLYSYARGLLYDLETGAYNGPELDSFAAYYKCPLFDGEQVADANIAQTEETVKRRYETNNLKYSEDRMEYEVRKIGHFNSLIVFLSRLTDFTSQEIRDDIDTMIYRLSDDVEKTKSDIEFYIDEHGALAAELGFKAGFTRAELDSIEEPEITQASHPPDRQYMGRMFGILLNELESTYDKLFEISCSMTMQYMVLHRPFLAAGKTPFYINPCPPDLSDNFELYKLDVMYNTDEALDIANTEAMRSASFITEIEDLVKKILPGQAKSLDNKRNTP